MKVRIGVVDTGVDVGCSAFDRNMTVGIGVRRDGDTYRYESDYHDLNGHGTVMAALIQSLCLDARICAVRIAQQDRNGAVVEVQEQALAMGIEWCVDQGIRIINVSYSIAEAPDNGFLAHVCRKAHENRSIIVAAYRNGEALPVYPAAFPTVIGVRGSRDLHSGQVSVLSEENHDLFAMGGSNSSATAQVSAMVGRIHTIDDTLGLEAVFARSVEAAIR